MDHVMPALRYHYVTVGKLLACVFRIELTIADCTYKVCLIAVFSAGSFHARYRILGIEGMSHLLLLYLIFCKLCRRI